LDASTAPVDDLIRGSLILNAMKMWIVPMEAEITLHHIL